MAKQGLIRSAEPKQTPRMAAITGISVHQNIEMFSHWFPGKPGVCIYGDYPCQGLKSRFKFEIKSGKSAPDEK